VARWPQQPAVASLEVGGEVIKFSKRRHPPPERR
jgi:hypothetical protein